MKFKYVALILVAAFLCGTFLIWSQAPKFVGRPTEYEFTMGGINGPRDVEVDSDGMIYVAAGTNQEIRIYRPDGTQELRFGHGVKKYNEEDAVGFVDMHGIGLDKDNNIYVAEKKGGRIRVFNSFGEPLLTINMPEFLQSIYNEAGDRVYKPTFGPEKKKLPGRKVYKVGFPMDIAISDNGNIYAIDGPGNRIVVFDYEGNLLTTFEYYRFNNVMVHFKSPVQLGFSSKGELFIMQTLRCNIVAVDAKGNFLRIFGAPGNIVGSFQRPLGLTIDDLDRVYCADFVIGSVQVFDDQGNFLHVLTDKAGEQWDVGNLMGDRKSVV